jgi:hypothetical protein
MVERVLLFVFLLKAHSLDIHRQMDEKQGRIIWKQADVSKQVTTRHKIVTDALTQWEVYTARLLQQKCVQISGRSGKKKFLEKIYCQ